MSRRLGPLAPDHPSVGQSCPACQDKIGPSAFVAIVPLGPGNDQEERKARDQGKPYNAVGVVVHWECSTQLDRVDILPDRDTLADPSGG